MGINSKKYLVINCKYSKNKPCFIIFSNYFTILFTCNKSLQSTLRLTKTQVNKNGGTSHIAGTIIEIRYITDLLGFTNPAGYSVL